MNINMLLPVVYSAILLIGYFMMRMRVRKAVNELTAFRTIHNARVNHYAKVETNNYSLLIWKHYKLKPMDSIIYEVLREIINIDDNYPSVFLPVGIVDGKKSWLKRASNNRDITIYLFENGYFMKKPQLIKKEKKQ